MVRSGVCISFANRVRKNVQSFGMSAQERVLTMSLAAGIAEDEDIFLQELGGTGQGIIGALSAVGLRATGCDGRFIALSGIRELEGVVKVSDLLNNSGLLRLLISLDGISLRMIWSIPLIGSGRVCLRISLCSMLHPIHPENQVCGFLSWEGKRKNNISQTLTGVRLALLI